MRPQRIELYPRALQARVPAPAIRETHLLILVLPCGIEPHLSSVSKRRIPNLLRKHFLLVMVPPPGFEPEPRSLQGRYASR